MQQTIALIMLLIAAVCNANTILWTNAAGNPLWNDPGNWDCRCVPTSADDVVIDLQAIPGNVQIGGVVAPALCNSLTIGGTSKFAQTLTVSGSLNIGTGGGVLNSNGYLLVVTSPNTPITNNGKFTSRGGIFSFSTGALAGTGSFEFPSQTVLNFTGSAAKNIATTVNVAGRALATDLKGTTLQLTNGGKLVIDGLFKASSALTISSDKTSSFVVKSGSFDFSGTTLTIQGSASINQWSLASGSAATLINTVSSGTLSLGSGSSLTLIGAPTDSRTFGSITGSGNILNEGGSNTFTSLTASSLTASGGSANFGSASVNSFTLSGATVKGGSIAATTAALTTGTLGGGAKLTASTLSLAGVVNVNDDGTTILVNGKGTIASASQLTLTGGSSFQVASSAGVTQSADFKFVQGPPSKSKPSIVISGSWASTSTLSIFTIPVSGGGSFSLSSSASWSLTNVPFVAASVSSQGSISLSQGNFNVTSVTGSGSISGSPATFGVVSLQTNGFSLSSGSVSVTSGSVSSLNIAGGTFFVGKTLSVGSLSFTAGTISGPTGRSTVNAKSTSIKGATTTLTHLQLTTGTLKLDCTAGTCAFFTNDAVVSTA